MITKIFNQERGEAIFRARRRVFILLVFVTIFIGLTPLRAAASPDSASISNLSPESGTTLIAYSDPFKPFTYYDSSLGIAGLGTNAGEFTGTLNWQLSSTGKYVGYFILEEFGDGSVYVQTQPYTKLIWSESNLTSSEAIPDYAYLWANDLAYLDVTDPPDDNIVKVKIVTFVANQDPDPYGSWTAPRKWSDFTPLLSTYTTAAEYPVIYENQGGTGQITIHGHVEDGYGHRLEGVKVTLVWGSNESTKYTNDQGTYTFSQLQADQSSSETAYLKVELTDEDGIIEIYDLQASSTQVAQYQTNNFSLKSGGEWLEDVEQNITFPNTSDSAATSDVREDHLDDLASIYWGTYTAVKFYRDKLGVTFGTGGLCDHIPVKVNAYNAGSDVYFSPSDGNIYIGGADGESDATSLEAPQNREWHEFSHYVQWDVYGAFPTSHSGDSNHGGFPNHCTDDSWVEGFAEFMAMAIDSWAFNRTVDEYPVASTVIPLEVNYLDDLGPNNFQKFEELSIASLLWDLYDGASGLDQDQVDLSITQLWGVLSQQRTFPSYYNDNGGWIGNTSQTESRYISYAKDLYDALIASGLAGSGAIDNTFINHGFYWDVNGNGMYNTGENIGVGDNSRPERRHFSLDNKMSVRVNVPAGAVPATLVVDVKFSAPYESYDYSYQAPITSASQSVLVWMPPAGYASTAHFKVQKDGYQDSETFTLNNDYYWSNVGLGDHVATHTFSFEPAPPMIVYVVAAIVVVVIVVVIIVIVFVMKGRHRVSSVT